MSDKDKLRELEIRIAKQVCDCRGFVTREEADLLSRLRQKLGARYDAINGRWINPGECQ